MTEPTYIRSLTLAGFRAYLTPKTFDFQKKRCLAIFAPNGNGKSSVIDGIEFLLSKDGTLERLGLRAVNNNAGITALGHILAEEYGISPCVSIEMTVGNQLLSGERAAAGAKRPMPEAAARINSGCVVSPIIRGHALRSFVEVHTPEQRYADVATWLQLAPLVEVQRNLRSLRSQVKAAADDDTALEKINTQLGKTTGGMLHGWNPVNVVNYLNAEVIWPLDKGLKLETLSDSDPAYTELEARRVAEEKHVGLFGLRQIQNAAERIRHQTVDDQTGEITTRGLIFAFEAMTAAFQQAVLNEAEEQKKAANAAFQALWKTAEPLFADYANAPLSCPVCATPIDKTAAGSAEAIQAHISNHLAELAAYAEARKALATAHQNAAKVRTDLIAALSGLIDALGDLNPAAKAHLEAYRTAATECQIGDQIDSTGAVTSVAVILHYVGSAITQIEAKQGDSTYAKAKASIDRLLELQIEHDFARQNTIELTKLSDSLTVQATKVSAEIRTKVQALLDILRIPMNEIYSKIQGANTLPIRLELPAEDETNQQRLNLLIDFAKNRVGVQPSGYLSDSQVHSVALALQLAAAKQFNTAAPILALDDIVTSYDADHRRSIAAMIATTFPETQIVITTHDERFFNYMKDQLAQKTWHFTRIIGLDPKFGPRFSDHKVTDEMIAARWAIGESAANEMRQSEEEWLLGICREFGVSVRIRELEKPYSYERSELASALAGFLKDAKLEPPPVAGVDNRFLSSLQKGEIENFGSHFQDGPYGNGSIGDEQARWAEFQTFRNRFACGKCKRVKFKRPYALKKPVCAHEACETQFIFSAGVQNG